MHSPPLLFIGLLGSGVTISNIPGWYASLSKPWFSPPNWLFGPVWTILYILMGLSLYLIIKDGITGRDNEICCWILWSPADNEPTLVIYLFRFSFTNRGRCGYYHPDSSDIGHNSFIQKDQPECCISPPSLPLLDRICNDPQSDYNDTELVETLHL